MPRGRPKGSKNKVKSVATTNLPKKRGRPARTDHLFSIEAGPVSYTFPIVQEETVKKPVAFLTVNSDSLTHALKDAVKWAREWSTTKSGNYWPLVNYVSKVDGISAEKRYVKVIGSYETMAYAENRDVGSWLPLEVLEVV